MKRSALVLLVSAGVLSAQNPKTAVYPSGTAADKDLGVQVNNVTTTLGASLTAGATSGTVASCTGLLNYTPLAIDNEILMLCSCSAGTAQFGVSACPNADGRGIDGSTAAPHNNGAAVSAYLIAGQHNQVAAEVKAIEANVPATGLCAQGNITGTVTINLKGCTLVTATLTGNVTSLSFTNAFSGQTGYAVQFTQDVTGSRTVTGVTGVNNFPCIIPTASKTTSFTMWYDGTNLWVTNSSSNSGYGCAVNGTAPGVSPPSGQIFPYVDPSLTVPSWKNSSGNKLNVTGAVLSDVWPVGDTVSCPNNTALGTAFATVATIPAFEQQGNQYVVDLDMKIVGVSGGPYQFYYGYYGSLGTTADTQVGNFQGGTPGSSVTMFNHISLYFIAATAPSASASLLVTAAPGNFGINNTSAISGNTVATDPITALATNASNKFTLAMDCATNASGSAQILHETVRRVY